MRIEHGRITLELHELARREGPALLLLHALFGSSPDWQVAPDAWPGPVYALDFCGHGRSDWLPGAAYYPELLLADADVALARIGRAAVAGAGLGAYVALLLAGARAPSVPAALLLPGAGLEGGGALPDFDVRFRSLRTVGDGRGQHLYDPMVRTLEFDVRPIDYASAFAVAAQRLLLAEDGAPRPPWWEAARRSPSAESVTTDLQRALTRLRALVEEPVYKEW
jgi:pimeloyl-ACP methyl ester carboxylesterase